MANDFKLMALTHRQNGHPYPDHNPRPLFSKQVGRIRMSDMTIKNILSTPFGKTENVRSISSDPISDFKNLLGQSVDDLNRQMAEANQSVQEMLMGKKDIHQTMIDMEMAGISLRMMIQFKNKIVAAYEEIMRMQV